MRNPRQIFLLFALLPLALPLAAPAQPLIQHRAAILQGLDKVTARISHLEAELDQSVRFGSLAIRVRACYETPPTEPPESAAFLEVNDHGTDGEIEPAFIGWMFASTPGISALEHPVYDVWVVGCREPLTALQAIPMATEPANQSSSN